MALSLRKQPGRTLLLVLAGSSLVLFFLNQSDLRTPFTTQPAQLHSGIYSHRKIQDYSSPEYTAPSDTGGAVVHDALKADVVKKDHPKNVLQPPVDAAPLQSGSSTQILSLPIDTPPEMIDEQGLNAAVIEESDPYNAEEEEKGIKILEEETLRIKDTEVRDDVLDTGFKPIPDHPQTTTVARKVAEEEKMIENPDVRSPGETNGQIENDSGGSSGTAATDSGGSQAKDEVKKEDDTMERAKEVAWINNIRPVTKQGFIDAIIDKQREVIAQAMHGYSFHPRLKAKKLDDLLLEKGGNPVRSVVITTWRSGSTFIGDVLQSHPATYYHYEPLLDFGIAQVRHGELAQQAVHNLRHLLSCNYTDMDHYLSYGPEHPWLFLHNTRLWHYCLSFPELCWDPDFLTPFCKLFPFQSLKTVRLRLNLTREFLQDKQLGVQVLLLVRDPRGTMQSRKHRDWCPESPDCDDPARLCNDLVSDYNTALDFRRKFPHSFRVVRYEDLSFNAYNMTKELFDFFHLRYHPRVQSFLDTHTKEKIGGASSTFRDSMTAPVHWQQDLSWQEVDDMQKVCGKALKLWGYARANNENHLRTFKPVRMFKFR